MEIKKIFINQNRWFTVGLKGVTKIVDNSIEMEQHLILQYDIYVDGKLKYTFINGNYEIEYKNS